MENKRKGRVQRTKEVVRCSLKENASEERESESFYDSSAAVFEVPTKQGWLSWRYYARVQYVHREFTGAAVLMCAVKWTFEQFLAGASKLRFYSNTQDIAF